MKKNFAIMNGLNVTFGYGSNNTIYESLSKFAKSINEPLKVGRQQFYDYIDSGKAYIVMNFEKAGEVKYNDMFAERCMLVFNDPAAFNIWKNDIISRSACVMCM